MTRRKIKPFTAELEVVDAASDGRGVARMEERVVFIPGSVPGDHVEVNIFKKEKKALIGQIKHIIKASEHRITPTCSHFGTCGGCKWQMMNYESQLKAKQKQVFDAFERIAKVPIAEKLHIMGSSAEYYYRNKLEFTFSNKAWLTQEQIASGETFDQRVLGFHVPRFFDKIIDIDHCYLQLSIINDIRNGIRDFARNQQIPFYDIRTHEGFLRSLVFRNSLYSGELMLVLVSGAGDKQWIDRIFEYVEENHPEVSSFLWIESQKLNSSFQDLSFHLWKGTPYITEQIGQYRFHISPTSFFQPNPAQAARFYGIIRSWAREMLPESTYRYRTIYDLYSGTGSIGIFISELAEKIVGIEYVQAAVDDAWRNVKLNQLEDKFSFYTGDMKEILRSEVAANEGKPDFVIADPPRQGMDPKVVLRILELAPEHIIYVSCKPSTQARDVALLSEQYDVKRIQPVDMFPQTVHVENLALLKKKPSA